MSMFEDVVNFQEKFKAYSTPMTKRQNESRFHHIDEELQELFIALKNEHRPDMLDALVDIVYVALGMAYVNNFNFEEAWKRVHESNMKKEQKSTDRSKYDVIKPEGWEPPNLGDLV